MTKSIIYRLVLVLCIGVSSFLSYFGFRPMMPNDYLCAAFVAIIGLILFSGGLLLQAGRTEGDWKRQVSALLLYLFAAIFSASSNFTAIFTNDV